MARYRPQRHIGDNLREMYSKLVQMTSSALGDSSIDWDDDGDDGSSLDITVNDSTVAKYGHFGDAHGFLVIGGGTGWRTVQDDAQVRANAAEADAKAHADALNTAMDGRVDTLNSEVNTLQSEMNTAQGDINDLEGWRANHGARISAIEGWLTLYFNFPNNPN